jgi:hemolysin activation/secretion protein
MSKDLPLRNKARNLLPFSICLIVFIPLKALAQNLPPGEQPGAQGARFQTESERNKNGSEKKKAHAPRIEIEKGKETPSPAQGISFILKNVKITGAAVFKPEDLSMAYEAYIGKQVTFKDLEEIASSIKERYKKKGYLLTDVYIPEQDIAQGTVEIRVSEGKLGELKVEGNKWFSSALLSKFIHEKKDQILNIFRLQKDMLRLNQNPDLDVTAVLSPGKEPATTDVVLNVKDSYPYHAGLNFDNLGTRLVGKDRISLALRSTNMTGRADSIAVNTLKSRSSSGEFLSYAVLLDTYGTRAGIDLTNFYMKLGREFRDQDITGTTQVATPHVSWELWLSPDFQGYVDLGMDFKSIKRKNSGEPVSNDQIRMPYAAFDLAKTDHYLGGGQTTFSPRLSFSTGHFLGGSSREHPSASRAGTGGTFFKYDQALNRIQKAPLDSFISIRSQFLAASRTLPSSEQLQLGGANSVRGYPEGEYLADIGAVLNAEWAFRGYIFPKEYKLPHAKMSLRDQFQPVIFLDLGEGKLKRTGPGERHRMFLMGAGAGLRFQFNRNFFLRLDWAKHLTDRPTQGQGPSNFYITCQAEI